jgi:hypothetical protein
MSQTSQGAPFHDERWGDHVPWSLRYNTVAEKGDFHKFMTMLATRLRVLFEQNEANILNIPHFLGRPISESIGRFYAKSGQACANMVYHYFAPATIQDDAKARAANDPEQKACDRLLHGTDRKAYTAARAIEQATKPARYAAHWRNLIAERLEVLQSIFVLLQQDKKHDALKALVRDVRRFAAESGICSMSKETHRSLSP